MNKTFEADFLRTRFPFNELFPSPPTSFFLHTIKLNFEEHQELQRNWNPKACHIYN